MKEFPSFEFKGVCVHSFVTDFPRLGITQQYARIFVPNDGYDRHAIMTKEDLKTFILMLSKALLEWESNNDE